MDTVTIFFIGASAHKSAVDVCVCYPDLHWLTPSCMLLVKTRLLPNADPHLGVQCECGSALSNSVKAVCPNLPKTRAGG